MTRGVSRRDFLKTVVVTAGAVKIAPLLSGCGDGGPIAVAFPQSVAAGDPRTDSIVLWTRAETTATGDVTLTLEVATDDQFGSLVTLTPNQIAARADADRCVRVKVTGLQAGTRYFYRFRAGGMTSPTGRFKTAAEANADAPVRFAVLSCQDYVGRYYNTLVELLDAAQDDLDFVVHLGDYVYETTGDPLFQAQSGRRLVFSDQTSAEQLGSAPNFYYAAKSLSNYRDLWKTYRSDPTLQKVHEKFPFIVTWDDHEFVDDCWQDAINYSDGVKVERDAERRRNAEQAFFEFQPVALDAEGSGELSLARDDLFPNTRLYRDFRFGKHLHLLMTDYRSFRPDHPIPEDGFPGLVVMDQSATIATLSAVLGSDAAGAAAFEAGDFRAYVNLDDAAFADHKATLKTVLEAAYLAAGADATRATSLAAAAAQGNVDVTVLNAWLPAALMIDPAGRMRGVSLAFMGKTALFGSLGARYLVVKATYDLYAAYRQGQAPGSDDPYGSEQSAWLTGRLTSNSDATWKVLGNSTALTSLILDVPDIGLPIPATKFYLNADHWDGFPVGRTELFTELYAQNAVLISGDIHAAYFTDYGSDAGGNRVLELTGPGVSSKPFTEELRSTARSIGLDDSLVDSLLGVLDEAFLVPAFPPLKYANSNVNGVMVIRIAGTELEGRYALLAPSEAFTDQTASPGTLAAKFIRKTVIIPKVDGKNGEPSIT